MAEDNFYNSTFWRSLSKAVTTNAACRRCGSRSNLVAHHKVPRSKGGRDVLSNLEPICRTCHPTHEAVTKMALGQLARPVLRTGRGSALLDAIEKQAYGAAPKPDTDSPLVRLLKGTDKPSK